MQPDLSGVRGAMSLDDDQFREMIRMAATAMGLPAVAVNSAVANAPMLRMMLANASDRDLEKVVNQIGKDKTDEILSKFN